MPLGKRTLIGIAAPVIEPKTSLVDTKPPAPAETKPPVVETKPPLETKPPIEMKLPVDPVPETRRDRPSTSPGRAAVEEPRPSTAKSANAQTRKETPEARAAFTKAAEARDAASKQASIPPAAPEKSSRLGPILLVAALGAAAVWFVMNKQGVSNQGSNEPPTEATPAAQPAEPEKPAALPVPEATAAAPEPTQAAAASAAAAPATAPAQSAAPRAPTPEPSPPADTGSAPAEGVRVVIVKLMPPDARLFRKGKIVGKSPVRIELPAGEKKRAYEVGRPGYVTRRLVVDGSQAEISIGLRPEAGAQ